MAADLRQRAARLESFAAELATRLDELIGKARDSELRARLKSRIHGMLHATTDPYLSFAEIAAAMRAAGEPFDVGGAGSEPASDGPITQRDVELRRALIELIEAQAIAQLAGDRYFIASEFETDADDA